jgi:hypothetical protein
MICCKLRLLVKSRYLQTAPKFLTRLDESNRSIYLEIKSHSVARYNTNRMDPDMNHMEANAPSNPSQRPANVEIPLQESISQDSSPTSPTSPEPPSQKPSLRTSDVHHDFIPMHARDEGISSWSSSPDKQLGSQTWEST